MQVKWYYPLLSLWVFLCALMYADKIQTEFSVINTPVMREATMIDTHSTVYHSRSITTVEAFGLFVDKETGLKFYDNIGDSLYRQFERDGNKPIEVKWRYTDAKRGGESKGRLTTLTILSFITWLVLLVTFICLVCTTIDALRGAKSEEHH